ncbi:hypothetical protein XANCAGTX0491_005800 [Xanthoria calcicola]
MGWLSSSKKAGDASTSSPLSDEAPTDSAPVPQNDSSNAELQAFLSSLETTPNPTNTPQESLSADENTSSSTPSSNLITASTILPSTISCQAAFDSAYYCQSLGGQFNNVYRYGTLRDCREQWKQFWFCMKTNRGFLGDEEREKRVRQHYKLREMKYRVGPSSEDVWKPRTRMVEGAFERSLEEDERMEREQALLKKS